MPAVRFQSCQEIPFPAEEVFALVRDGLPDLVPFLPNVESIELVSREELGPGLVKVVHRWHGKAEIPSVVARFVPVGAVGWTDTAVWDERERSCRWKIEPAFWGGHVRCEGVNLYRSGAGGAGTRLEITGDLQVGTGGIPGVPRLLQSKAAEQIEKFVVRLLTPNLDSLARGVTRFLEKGKKSARSV